MSDDFDDELREVFGRRASDAPRVDLAGGAVRQAGRIRRRRRVLSGVAVLAAAAFVIPAGAHLIDADPADHTTSKPVDDSSPARPVDVALAGLPQGGDPAVPYIDAETFTSAGGSRTAIPAGSVPAIDAFALDDSGSIAAWHLDLSTGRLNYTADGDLDGLPQGTSATSPAIDATTKGAAWVAKGTEVSQGLKPVEALISVDPSGGWSVAGLDDLNVQQVMGVSDHEVLVNARQDGKAGIALLRPSGTDVYVEQPWSDVVNVTAVDPGFTRFAGRTTTMTGASRGCSAMLDFDSGDEQWQTCDWRPVEFSSDGSLVLAIGASTEGLGPRELAVLRADDGSLVQSFTTEGTFGRATFEGSESVDTVLTVGDQAAIVRCSIADGDCELATDLADVAPDDPASLTYPYQLTAN